MDQHPDFYMTSSENHDLKPLRKCYKVKRIPVQGRDDYLLIRIDPSLEFYMQSVVDNSDSMVVIAARHKGVSLFPIKKWPVSVYVLRIKVKDPEHRNSFQDHELELFGWADLFPSALEAL